MSRAKTTKHITKKKEANKRKSVTIAIDKKLDSLSNTILFKKKLEKANRILSESGVPAWFYLRSGLKFIFISGRVSRRGSSRSIFKTNNLDYFNEESRIEDPAEKKLLSPLVGREYVAWFVHKAILAFIAVGL